MSDERNKIHSRDWKRWCAHFIFAAIVISSAILFFCILNNGHNWGGDFSAYIMQAQSICDLDPSTYIELNRFTIEQSSAPMGPVAYPWGFPVILSIFYAVFGLNIFVLKTAGALCYLVFLVVLWIGFRKHHTPIWLLALVSIFAFSPAMISFANAILSDIPFLLFSTLAVLTISRLVVEKRELIAPVQDGFLLGLVIAIAFFIRTNGLLLLGVLCWAQVMSLLGQIWQAKNEQVTWKQSCAQVLWPDSLAHRERLLPLLPYASFFLILFLWKLSFPEGGTSHLDYLNRISWDTILDHTDYYSDLLSLFYAGIPDNEKFHGRLVTYLVSLPFVLIGMIRRFRSDHHIIVYILATFVLYITWPTTQGLRFLFPVLPFYISFFIAGLSFFVRGKLWYWRVPTGVLATLPVAVIICFFLMASVNIAGKQLDAGSVIRSGPFSEQSLEMFNYIKEHTEKDSTIVFFKPRVMRMFTQRNTLQIFYTDDLFAGDYLCLFSQRSNRIEIDQIRVLEQEGRAALLFENKVYKLYRLGSGTVAEE